jgi:peptidoglycan/LPS O-acetylase OafA/YrhL
MPLISFPPRSASRSAAASRPALRQASVPRSVPDGYQPQFDGLRALAVLTVMMDHFSAGVPNFPLPDSIRLGATGVRLFLVLSGYFITSSLRRARGRIDTGGLSVRKALASFYWRRFLRILPAYGLFVTIGLTLNLGTVRENWAWLATCTVNWLIALHNEWPPAISHLWSICVQEQFYLLWPLLILLLPRKWMMRVILGVAIAGVAFRVGCVMFSVPMIARWVLPFGSLDSLAAGAALGWYGGRLRPTRAGWLIGAVCLSMLILAAMWRDSDPTRLKSVLVEPLEASAFVVLVARTAFGFHGVIARLLTLPGLIFAGRISYGLYIYHVMVAVLFDLWMPSQLRWLLMVPAARLTMFGVVTLLVAALSWRLLEEPVNRFRGGKKRTTVAPFPTEEPVAPLAVLAVRAE